SLRRKSLIWVENVPAQGLQALCEPAPPPESVEISENTLENTLIHLIVEANGTLTVRDKQTQRVYSGLHQWIRNAEQGDSYNAAPIPGHSREQARLISVKNTLNG